MPFREPRQRANDPVMASPAAFTRELTGEVLRTGVRGRGVTMADVTFCLVWNATAGPVVPR